MWGYAGCVSVLESCRQGLRVLIINAETFVLGLADSSAANEII